MAGRMVGRMADLSVEKMDAESVAVLVDRTGPRMVEMTVAKLASWMVTR